MCDNCSGTRIIRIDAKVSDQGVYQFQGNEISDDYAPDVSNICRGDYIDLAICLDCGKTQGSFPVDTPEEFNL